MDTISFAWFFKNARHVGDGGFRTRTRYLSTVDFVTAMPIFANSPTMRGEPHVGFIDDIVRISSLTSSATGGRPGSPDPDNFVQCSLKRLRCQRMTVSGLTKMSASFHPVQALARRLQKTRSACRTFGRLDAPPVHAQLMPQSQILRLKRCARHEHGNHKTGTQSDEFNHIHSDDASEEDVRRSRKGNRWCCDVTNSTESSTESAAAVSPCLPTRANIREPQGSV